MARVNTGARHTAARRRAAGAPGEPVRFANARRARRRGDWLA